MREVTPLTRVSLAARVESLLAGYFFRSIDFVNLDTCTAFERVWVVVKKFETSDYLLHKN